MFNRIVTKQDSHMSLWACAWCLGLIHIHVKGQLILANESTFSLNTLQMVRMNDDDRDHSPYNSRDKNICTTAIHALTTTKTKVLIPKTNLQWISAIANQRERTARKGDDTTTEFGGNPQD